jgi:diguanylate cyclase (GGDEF)-like protein
MRRTPFPVHLYVTPFKQPSILFGMAMIALVWSGTYYQSETERWAEEQTAVEHSQSLARMFEENVVRTISEVDTTLRLVRYVHEATEGKTDWVQLVSEAQDSAEITLQFGAINKQGQLIARGHRTQRQELDLSDRGYFELHRKSKFDQLYISKPTFGRISGQWRIHLTRPILDRKNNFDGVLLASLDPANLTHFYDGIGLSSGMGITLIGTDGVVRATAGSSAFALGSQSRMNEWADGMNIDRAANKVTIVRSVRSYPVRVIVQSGLVQLDGFLLRNRLRYGALATGLTLLILVGVYLGMRHHRNLEAARQRASRSEAISRSKSLELENTLDNISQGILMVDGDDRIAVMNRQCARLLGLSETFVTETHTYSELIEYLTKAGEFGGPDAEAGRRALDKVWLPNAAEQFPVHEHRRPDGTVLTIRTRGLPHGGFVRTLSDVTKRRRDQQQILHLARHDGLTGLANRALFKEQLEAALATADETSGLAVHLVDLDGFKSVNDTYGHAMGDKLLAQVASRLVNAVRAGDMVARLGGDEFAVVHRVTRASADAELLAGRLCRALYEPFQIDGHQMLVGASVGVAIGPEDGGDVSTLLKAADLALYAAKADGRNTWRMFEPEMYARREERLTVKKDLEHALSSGEFELHYQQFNDADAGEITGYEALLRWRTPEGEIVGPSKFIPLAEESGLIVRIGAWALETACSEMARRPEHLRVSVNLSPVQFHNQDLVGTVERALEKSGLSPSRLELEITESVVLQKDPLTLRQLKRLRDLGVSIAVDDFGTGYSSLSYLLSYPVDRIKIDRSFVTALGKHRGSSAVVRAIITLAESLGMSITAEGVETREQLVQLRELGCREVQGFYFSRPVPSADLDARAPAADGRRISQVA